MKKRLMVRNPLRQIRHGFTQSFMVIFESPLQCDMKCGSCAWQHQQPENREVPDRVFARMDDATVFGALAGGGTPCL